MKKTKETNNVHEGHVLNWDSPAGFIVSVSAQPLNSKDIDANLYFVPDGVDNAPVFNNNYRPHLVLTGTVSAIEAAFGSSDKPILAKSDAPTSLVVEYELSNEEIAQLASKGFFNERYPMHEITIKEMVIPHKIPVLEFEHEEAPVVVSGLRSSDRIITNKKETNQDIISVFPQFGQAVIHSGVFDKNGQIKELSDVDVDVWPGAVVENEFLQKHGLDIDQKVSNVNEQDVELSVDIETKSEPKSEVEPETDIDEILQDTLERAAEPPVVEDWMKSVIDDGKEKQVGEVDTEEKNYGDLSVYGLSEDESDEPAPDVTQQIESGDGFEFDN